MTGVGLPPRLPCLPRLPSQPRNLCHTPCGAGGQYCVLQPGCLLLPPLPAPPKPHTVLGPTTHPAQSKSKGCCRRESVQQGSTGLSLSSHHCRQLAAAKPFKTRLELSRMRIANTGWIGLRDDGASTKEKVSGAAETGNAPTHLLSAFFGPTAKLLGFKLVKASREETPLIDSSSLVWGVCSGIDNDPGLQADATAAAVVMEEARGKASLGDKRTVHCCGNFSSLTRQEALHKLGAKFNLPTHRTFTRHTNIFDDPSSTVFSLPAPSISALTPVPLAIKTLPISLGARHHFRAPAKGRKVDGNTYFPAYFRLIFGVRKSHISALFPENFRTISGVRKV
ncbi:hypothetical protein C8R47DRAFT_1084859 [Mycena vitilis]|nr:hypothetical protein C8R47DRAFT_1084859 [Mycena vitilis]